MTDPDPSRLISTLRKRRGVAKASITRLAKSLPELRANAHDPKTLVLAQHATKRLDALSQDFQQHHAKIVDLLEGEEELAREQEALDIHDDDVSRLTVELEQIIVACPTTHDSGAHKVVSRRIAHLRKGLEQIVQAVNGLSTEMDDVSLLRHHEEQLTDMKCQL